MPKPNNENKIIGLRPYLSLRFPITGANKNCMIAYVDKRMPPDVLASLTGIFLSPAISLGITGMITPNPIESINMVIKINPNAAFRDFAINRDCNYRTVNINQKENFVEEKLRLILYYD